MSYRGPRIRPTKSPLQYPMMQYPYQDWGKQLTWRDAPPPGTRAGDTKGLGDYYQGSFIKLPRAGAPEIIRDRTGYAGTDCACHDKTGVAGVVESISALSTPVKVAGAVGLYLLIKTMTR